MEWGKFKNLYEEFLFGRTVMGRKNPAPLAILTIAERKVWQIIVDEMAVSNTTLGQALEAAKSNHLWWTNELDTKQAHQGQPPRHSGAPSKCHTITVAKTPVKGGRDRKATTTSSSNK